MKCYFMFFFKNKDNRKQLPFILPLKPSEPRIASRRAWKRGEAIVGLGYVIDRYTFLKSLWWIILSADNKKAKFMGEDNHTTVKKIILAGLTDCPELQLSLFVTFFLIYVMTLLGNLGIIMLIRIDLQLHTPMYFFLSHLSFVDACYSSTIAPNMLVNFLMERRAITSTGCFT